MTKWNDYSDAVRYQIKWAIVSLCLVALVAVSSFVLEYFDASTFETIIATGTGMVAFSMLTLYSLVLARLQMIEERIVALAAGN